MAKTRTFSFPHDLLDLQRDLNRTRAEYAALCRTLPWSAEPLPGWTHEEPTMGPAGPRTVRFDDSPGYTPEQAVAERRLHERLLELAEAVCTHPYWETLAPRDRADARSALKHVHDERPSDGEPSDGDQTSHTLAA